MTRTACVFCDLDEDRVLFADDIVYVIRDAYPVSNGHTLAITRRHVGTWWEATEAEQRALLAALEHAREGLDDALAPDGYNIGINAGTAAGQTVMHLHVHLIPRFEGDTEDPRGGVRHCIPGKGYYQAE